MTWARHIPAILFTALLTVCCEKPEQPAPVKPDKPEEQQEEYSWPSDATVVGTVSAEGKGIAGVEVSDGYIITTTDDEGRYTMKSEKKHGYVFISTPSGYKTGNAGVLPKFFGHVGKYRQDTLNFALTPVSQDNFLVYLLGDMHLADKRRDLSQFEDFVKDLDALRQSHSGFAITLGDMSWDAYWSGFDLEDYLALMNEKFGSGKQPLTVYHTIGNHDHQLDRDGDWDTAARYKEIIGPTYYSFNAGGFHFIILDDILCRNSGGQRSSWNEIDTDQLAWLKADISHISPHTPVIVATHAPLYSSDSSFYMYNGWDVVKAFSGFDAVWFFSGHTHVCYNIDYQGRPGYIPVFEGNSGAVCGNWWYMQYDFPKEKVNLCPDGAPAGYRILEIDSGKLKWHYKGTGRPSSYQMRTYDRNCICLDPDKYVPNASKADRAGFEAIASDYVKASSDNYVLINIWDYDPSWTVSVTENGTQLKVDQTGPCRDPLYLSSYEAYSYNHAYTTDYGSGTRSSYYPSSETRHMFRVRASSPSTTLTIEVTDRFGQKYTETMTRPKPFRLEY